ncbi:MAG: glycosyl hydrolase 108 family protein [Bacteroidota bacterium]
MADFKQAFIQLNFNEGKYVNDPDDSGGETYKGISRDKNPKWKGWAIIDSLRKQVGFPDSLGSNLELPVLHEHFFNLEYWFPMKGNSITSQSVALSIFDFGANVGIVTSIQFAQNVVGTHADVHSISSGHNTTTGLLPERKWL